MALTTHQLREIRYLIGDAQDPILSDSDIEAVVVFRTVDDEYDLYAVGADLLVLAKTSAPDFTPERARWFSERAATFRLRTRPRAADGSDTPTNYPPVASDTDGGGVAPGSFLALSDTPMDYADGQFVQSTASGIVFVDAPAGGGMTLDGDDWFRNLEDSGATLQAVADTFDAYVPDDIQEFEFNGEYARNEIARYQDVLYRALANVGDADEIPPLDPDRWVEIATHSLSAYEETHSGTEAAVEFANISVGAQSAGGAPAIQDITVESTGNLPQALLVRQNGRLVSRVDGVVVEIGSEDDYASVFFVNTVALNTHLVINLQASDDDGNTWDTVKSFDAVLPVTGAQALNHVTFSGNTTYTYTLNTDDSLRFRYIRSLQSGATGQGLLSHITLDDLIVRVTGVRGTRHVTTYGTGDNAGDLVWENPDTNTTTVLIEVNDSGTPVYVGPVALDSISPAPAGNTDLVWTASATAGTMQSSTGDNAFVAGATDSLAGLQSAAHHAKVDGIAAGAEVNVTELPAVDTSNNDQVLTVVSGAWTNADATGGGGGTDDQDASEVSVDGTQFDGTGNLSSSDTDVQTALETIDGLTLGGGGAASVVAYSDTMTNVTSWYNTAWENVMTGLTTTAINQGSFTITTVSGDDRVVVPEAGIYEITFTYYFNWSNDSNGDRIVPRGRIRVSSGGSVTEHGRAQVTYVRGQYNVDLADASLNIVALVDLSASDQVFSEIRTYRQGGSHTATVEGEVAIVKAGGAAGAAGNDGADGDTLPTVSATNNDQVLTVVSGVWAAADASGGGGSGEDNVQADLFETDTTDDAYVQNSPFAAATASNDRLKWPRLNYDADALELVAPPRLMGMEYSGFTFAATINAVDQLGEVFSGANLTHIAITQAKTPTIDWSTFFSENEVVQFTQSAQYQSYQITGAATTVTTNTGYDIVQYPVRDYYITGFLTDGGTTDLTTTAVPPVVTDTDTRDVSFPGFQDTSYNYYNGTENVGTHVAASFSVSRNNVNLERKTTAGDPSSTQFKVTVQNPGGYTHTIAFSSATKFLTVTPIIDSTVALDTKSHLNLYFTLLDDSGSTYIIHKIINLIRLDVGAAALPTDGEDDDVLTWDDTNSVWIAAAPTGGGGGSVSVVAYSSFSDTTSTRDWRTESHAELDNFDDNETVNEGGFGTATRDSVTDGAIVIPEDGTYSVRFAAEAFVGNTGGSAEWWGRVRLYVNGTKVRDGEVGHSRGQLADGFDQLSTCEVSCIIDLDEDDELHATYESEQQNSATRATCFMKVDIHQIGGAKGDTGDTGAAGDTLPTVTSADNDDVLTVVAGVWAKADPPAGGGVTVLPNQPGMWFLTVDLPSASSPQSDNLQLNSMIGHVFSLHPDPEVEYSMLYRAQSGFSTVDIRQSLYVWSDANSRWDQVDTQTATLTTLSSSDYMPQVPVKLPSTYTGDVFGKAIITMQVSSSDDMQISRRSVHSNFDVLYPGITITMGISSLANFTISTFDSRAYHTVYRYPTS